MGREENKAGLRIQLADTFDSYKDQGLGAPEVGMLYTAFLNQIQPKILLSNYPNNETIIPIIKKRFQENSRRYFYALDINDGLESIADENSHEEISTRFQDDFHPDDFSIEGQIANLLLQSERDQAWENIGTALLKGASEYRTKRKGKSTYFLMEYENILSKLQRKARGLD